MSEQRGLKWWLEEIAIWLHRRIVCRPGCGCPYDLTRARLLASPSNRSAWKASGTFDPAAYNARLAELEAKMERDQPGITEALETTRKTMDTLPDE